MSNTINLSDLANTLADTCLKLETTMNEAEYKQRYETRENTRLDLYKREIEQLSIIREEQHEAHLKELAHVQAHRERIEQIETENIKHLASIAESLQTIAKKVLETS